MGALIWSEVRTERGAFYMLLLISICCVGGKCEMQESKPSPPTNFLTVKPFQNEMNEPQAFPEEERPSLPVFTMDYPRIQVPFEFTLWVLLASFAKIGFHIYHKITIWIPESCLLIAIGLIVGGIMHSVKEEPPAVLSSNVFFLYMLPPIVLESGYFMPTRPFFENIGTVLWYSVVGTLWNSIGIGLSLYAICQFEVFGLQDINLQENLLFASIISAVDPVAVLNVFEDIGVNEQIHIVIFGEGLFNDAVTVALYSIFSFVTDMSLVESTDVFLGVARFVVVGVGGVSFGMLFGFVAAFTTRFTHNTRQIEPLFIFMYSYLAYLVAELFGLSSVLAIITCAITMKFYVEENVSQRSCTTIRHVIKMLATVSETLIFFFLGVVTITSDHEWNWAYIMFTLLFAFIWRVIGILVLTQIINPFRTIQFTFKDQFGLSYGGLRGAICFALVFTLPNHINRRNLFVTASIAIIIFTVLVQGISIRPIVEYINIRRTNKDLNTINVEVHNRVMEHIVSGIEDLCGQWSHFYWKDKFKKFNDRILRRILLRDNRAESSIVSLYKKLELQTAIGLLDTPLGDLSAAPSIVSLHDERKEASRSKKKFLAADVRKMHDILSKNMYKIRQKTMAYTNKYNLPENNPAREILIRRHASIRRSLRAESFREQPALNIPKSQKYFSLQPGGDLESAFHLRRRSHGGGQLDRLSDRLQASGVSPRSSYRSEVSMRRLNTIKESGSTGEKPVAPGLDVLDERGPGSLKASSLRGRKGPVPAPRRHSSNREADVEPADSEGEGEETVRPPQLPPPRGWVPDNQDLNGNGAGNPLLRHTSQGSRGSGT
ncbi:sodium/hydrogen exchanger 2-like [Thunnus maccoyii]|uniref:sodium/hydrogen exchanger 2-like n=1 Tax=Thunnus maccoyii TaxID=8240 RepID=UPI001C4BADC9|nr:sodium/hydrogen exchanger 2-like [Thunnus maccoyii]